MVRRWEFGLPNPCWSSSALPLSSPSPTLLLCWILVVAMGTPRIWTPRRRLENHDLLCPPLLPASLHIRGQKIGNPEMHFSRDELIGPAFIVFGITLFVCFFYVAIVSKLLPPYENQFLAAIQNDWYYCLLVPLTLPVIIVAVYLHWLSMKMFKHA